MNNIKDWNTFLENRNTLFGIGTEKGVLKKGHRYIRELLNERKLERFDYLLELLKSYNLPYGEYAVFGSAPLAIKGMINRITK